MCKKEQGEIRGKNEENRELLKGEKKRVKTGKGTVNKEEERGIKGTVSQHFYPRFFPRF